LLQCVIAIHQRYRGRTDRRTSCS